MKTFKRFLLALFVMALSSPALAQWQVEANKIPLGKGGGNQGFNVVGNQGTAGAQCLIDTVPPSFGNCSVSGSEIVFNTLALATAAKISPTPTQVRTLGRVASGDYGGASYGRIGASTPAAYRFQSADGQWWALNNRVITPEMFGCFSGSDCTSALASLSTVLQSASSGGIVNGGLIVNFKPGADYQIWPGTTTPTFAAISLINAPGVTINYNAARISTTNTWAHGNANVIYISQSPGITITNPSYSALDASCTTIDAFRCANHILVEDGDNLIKSNNIVVYNATQNGGSSFFNVNGLNSSNVSVGGSSGITILNANLQNVFYGTNFNGAGDNVTIRGLKGTNNGRLYFPVNVNNHDVELLGSTGGASFVRVLLATTGNPAATEERRTLANIKVRYKNVDNTITSAIPVGLAMGQVTPEIAVSGAVNNGAGLIRLTVSSTTTMATGQTWYVNSVGGVPNATGSWVLTVVDGAHVDLQASTFGGAYTVGGYMRVPQTIRDIDVDVNLSSTVLQPVAIGTYKTNSDGTPDTTTSGYLMANVAVKGTIRSYNYGQPAISLFLNNTKSTGTWTGETLRNISLRELVITGTNSSVLIDATNMSNPGLILENIYSTPTTVPWTITGINANTKIMNVNATGVTDRNTVVPSNAAAGQVATGISNQGAIAYGSPFPTPTRAGDIAYWNGTTWVTLAGNNSGTKILQEDAAGLPSWVASVGTPSAITKADDTNVTLTLGGTPATAALQAVSFTMGWTGQLGLTRGGTNNSLTASNGGLVWSDASKLNILAGTATAGFPALSGAAATPAWATITYPASATSGGVACFTSATIMASSGLLSGANIVVGGGAGACPTTSSTGGGVLTALSFSAGATGGYSTIIAQNTIALATGAIASGACTSAQTSAGTGIATTDVIDVGFNGDPTAVTGYIAPNMLAIIAYPTANTANFKVCNNTGASITPGAITLNWKVRR